VNVREIKAIIHPNRLARLREAFRKIPDFPGMTVTRAEGSGYHPGKPHDAGIKGELTEYSERIRIELVVPEEEVDRHVAIIHAVCHTGRAGDGVLWVTPVDRFHRLREPLG
jgi:nitrogen regulatory protein P-II 1